MNHGFIDYVACFFESHSSFDRHVYDPVQCLADPAYFCLPAGTV